MKRFCQKERSGLFGSPFQRLLFCCRRVFPVGSVASGTEAERAAGVLTLGVGLIRSAMTTRR